MEVDFLEKLPSQKKPIKERLSVSNEDRIKSWRLNKHYFDGSRKQGYGGYYYDGRWKNVAQYMIEHYSLKQNAKILDIGCAKGYLLKEFKDILKKSTNIGVDISDYAIEKSHKKIKENLVVANSIELPFENNFFDLTISINSLHNILDLNSLETTFKEIKRVSKKNIFISLGTYETKKEKKILDNWAVVATTYMHKKNWLKFFKKNNFKCDYSWFKPF
tara:strand:- start:5858 stop:6511 length:654 start_codon:yes stop_codon:yes gene_type:complete